MNENFITPPPVEAALRSVGVPPPKNKKNNHLLTIILIIATILIGGGVIYLTAQLGNFRGDNRQRAFEQSGSLACGQSCSADSECRNPSANGGPVGCRAGKCENLACPTGKTIPGANCDCSVAARQCGQTCGASVGLCGDGRSTCRFLTGLTCKGNEFNNATVCVPNVLPTGWSLSKCNNNPNGNSFALKNGSNPTQADVQSICQVAHTTCYKCTDVLTDANTCEMFTVSDATCPAGSSTTADACATAATGGACPTPTPAPTITCYKCTDTLTDANTCESFSSTETVCPAGSTATANACATVATGGACPTPQPTPASCNIACNSSIPCSSGLTCYQGMCRNSSCNNQTNCVCPTAVATPILTSTPTPSVLPDTGFEIPTKGTLLGGGVLLLLGILLSL